MIIKFVWGEDNVTLPVMTSVEFDRMVIDMVKKYHGKSIVKKEAEHRYRFSDWEGALFMLEAGQCLTEGWWDLDYEVRIEQ